MRVGISGEADWTLLQRIVADDFTFVTNNAADFRKLYVRVPLHAGLVIIVPQVAPAMQRWLFNMLLEELAGGQPPVNEAIELRIEGGAVVMERYYLPDLDS